MKTITIILLLLLLTAVMAAAQTRTFRWEDELCQYAGTYSTKTVTPAKLRNTLKLIRPGSYSLETNTTAWKISDIKDLDVPAFEREYARKTAELKALDIVRQPYWENLRQEKLREMEQVYRLNRITMRAYQDQKILLEYKDAPACSAKYANPMMSGGEDLLRVWLVVNEDSRKKNADPDRLRRIYEQQLASPDRLRYALIEVMNFGWSNCANDLIQYVDYDGSHEKEFKKLFSRVRTIRCDEP